MWILTYENTIRLYVWIIFFALIACLESCLGEDRSDCPIAKDEPGSLATTNLHLHFVMPDESWIEYQSRSAESMSCVIELYDKAHNSLVCHLDTIVMTENYGCYGVELEINQGNYQVLAWMTTDTDASVYDTSDLKSVRMLSEVFSDKAHDWHRRIAYCASMDIEANDDECHIDVNLTRPFAIYQLYIIDGDEYSEMAKEKDWPPLDRLGARIYYDGFYPTGLNVATGYPNDAIAGINYEIEVDFDQDEHVLVGEDAVLAHGDDSFLMASILIYDKTTGETVTTSSGIKIPYREGCATTLHGAWLCSSQSQGGVGIDTSWNEVIIPF